MWVHREKAKRGPSEKVAICKPRREASGETKLADTLILDLNYEKKKKKMCCLSHSVCSISLWQLSLTKTGPIGVAPGQEKTSWGCSQAGHAGLRWPHQRECRVTLWDRGSPLERRQEQDGVVAVTVLQNQGQQRFPWLSH